MTRRLYAFLPAEGDMPDMLYDACSDAMVEVEKCADRDEVWLFVPGPDVAIFEVPLPARNEKEARQAAPYMIEDELAESVDDVHIALEPRQTDASAPRTVYAVSHACMEDWISRTERAGLANARLLCEHAVTPPGALLALSDRIVGHTSGGPIALDASLPADLTAALLEGAEPQRAVGDGLTELANFAEGLEVRVDLRQGTYRRVSQLDLSALKTWRLSAALAAAVCAIWIGVGVTEIDALENKRHIMRQDMMEAYQAAFPDAPRNVDPVRALARRSSDKSGDLAAMDFLDTAAALYEALEDVPGARFRNLRFDPERGGFSTGVIYRNYGDDAAFKAALEAAGYRVRIGDARQTADGVNGEVMVEGVR